MKVWDELMQKGKPFDIHAAGMIALDIARIEAGLILIEVDYTSSKKALIASQKYSPAEIGLAKLVDLKKESFVGREALAAEIKKGGPARVLVGIEIDWNEVEALYEKIGMAPQVPSMASRVAVPVYRGGRARWQGDFDDVVADAEEDDCAGHGWPRAFCRGNNAAHGIDGGSSAAHSCRESCAAAVFQSGEENRDAGSLRILQVARSRPPCDSLRPFSFRVRSSFPRNQARATGRRTKQPVRLRDDSTRDA